MKKSSRLISLVLAIGLIAAMLVSCSKKPADTGMFKNLAKENEFTAQDVLSQFSDTPQIKEATVTAPKTLEFQIEFYVLDSTSFAKTFFNNLSDVIESQKESPYSGSSVNGKNYAKRTMTSGGKYTMVEYVENTVIYVPLTDAKYKSVIESFLKGLSY